MSGTHGSLTEPIRVHVVGIGADGWDGLGTTARSRIEHAAVVVGSARQLDLLPPLAGQDRRALPTPLRAGLVTLLDQTGPGLVVLASGDPLLSGVGTTLVDLLGAEAVDVLPAVSSVALARSRMRWSAESSVVVSVVGRDLALARREFADGRRLLVLSSDEATPSALAELLVEAGFGASRMTVLGDLGHASESRVEGTADSWNATVPRLNMVAVEVAGTAGLGWVAGLPDDAYEHDGQLTKRDLRASALARLAPTPGEHLWDVGAGAGSIGIEWMRAHPSCRATAIESDPERADRVARNAAKLGVPTLAVVRGFAPDALTDLESPDAIFIGGGATRPGVLESCMSALAPGGRLVVHGVTVETEQLLADAYRTYGGELTRIGVESAAPVGSFTGWTPARTVTQWAWTR